MLGDHLQDLYLLLRTFRKKVFCKFQCSLTEKHIEHNTEARHVIVSKTFVTINIITIFEICQQYTSMSSTIILKQYFNILYKIFSTLEYKKGLTKMLIGKSTIKDRGIIM